MPVRYKVPKKHYFRIHHIRSRFKNDVENVLIFMATEISKIPKGKRSDFMRAVFNAIRRYPGNATKKIKTINNWRTEISSLFGFVEFDIDSQICWPSAMSENLATNQDLVEFFKYFLFYFQYPGGHLKPHETLKYIKAEVRFKPARYLLDLFSKAEEMTDGRFGITKAELTHCVFNDLRVTKEDRPPGEVLDLILDNREKGVIYDWTGDVVRYAGDILDYMVNANLLVLHGTKYYLNRDERESIAAFLESDLYFEKYDSLYEKVRLSIDDVKAAQDDWFHYVNQRIEPDIFKTDLFRYLGIDEAAYTKLPAPVDELLTEFQEKVEVTAKEIGDVGEYLIHGHECMRVKTGGKEELIKLIKRIPTAFAVGYDISSRELDGSTRLIEVKTTISRRKVVFNKFNMTPNEWKVAESFDGRYFIYRLMISKKGTRLFIIQDPVGKYKSNVLQMIPAMGAEITFSEDVGRWEKLLIWKA